MTENENSTTIMISDENKLQNLKKQKIKEITKKGRKYELRRKI